MMRGSKGAGNLAASVGHPTHDTAERDRSPRSGGCRCRALRSADGAGKIQVGVVEEVVELGAELNFQALDRSAEVFVEREVGLVERRGAARIAAGIAKGAKQYCRQRP